MLGVLDRRSTCPPWLVCRNKHRRPHHPDGRWAITVQNIRQGRFDGSRTTSRTDCRSSDSIGRILTSPIRRVAFSRELYLVQRYSVEPWRMFWSVSSPTLLPLVCRQHAGPTSWQTSWGQVDGDQRRVLHQWRSPLVCIKASPVLCWKTEVLWFGTAAQLRKIPQCDKTVRVGGRVI